MAGNEKESDVNGGMHWARVELEDQAVEGERERRNGGGTRKSERSCDDSM